jgi:hypothetical protein
MCTYSDLFQSMSIFFLIYLAVIVIYYLNSTLINQGRRNIANRYNLEQTVRLTINVRHHVTNNNTFNRRIIFVLSLSLPWYVYICICLWVGYNTHLLTSLRQLVFHHCDFDNYLFFPSSSRSSINSQSYIFMWQDTLNRV